MIEKPNCVKTLTAVNQLEYMRGRVALCTICLGVGQGSALLIERTA